jgi:serine/threonine-protein kinase RsbW
MHGSVAPEGRLQNDSGVLKYGRHPHDASRWGNGGPVAVMSRMETSRLVLHGELAELDRLTSWIERWAEQSVPPDTMFALQLCLEEAVANIIMHGRANEDRAEIAIELEHDGETLRARVEDAGERFDPTEFQPPSRAASLEQAKVGDLGIHLMRSFASGIHYERRDHRNRCTFSFAGPQASAA